MYHSTYEEFLVEFSNEFQREFGERKLNTISEKIINSKKLAKLFTVSREKGLMPNQKDYLHCLHEIPYFMFSKAETLAMGALLALYRWNQECNPNHLLGDENRMQFVAQGILSECGQLKLNL